MVFRDFRPPVKMKKLAQWWPATFAQKVAESETGEVTVTELLPGTKGCSSACAS
ncbi:MAG TPA: hypothetical protein VFA89_16365 [Terriglobales bacterium]|nr:hypothetical protein [Terriglobales bacterium]